MFPFMQARPSILAATQPEIIAMAWDPSHSGTATLSNNNRDVIANSTTRQFVFSTGTKNAGKLYFEVTNLVYQKHYTGLANGYSISEGDANQTYYSNSGSGNAQIFEKGVTYDSSARKGSVVGVHVDFTARRVWFSIDGVQFQGDPATGTSGFTLPAGPLYIITAPNDTTHKFRINTGQTAFAYTPASGYVAWSAFVPNPSAATWWTARQGSNTFTNNNRTATSTTNTGPNIVWSNATKNAGKLYFELTSVSGSYLLGGVGNNSTTDELDFNSTIYRFASENDSGISGGLRDVAERGTSIAAARSGNVLGVHCDFTARKMWFSINGQPVDNASRDPASGTNGYVMPANALFIIGLINRNGKSIGINAGHTDFAYPMAAGFEAWN